jgi:hypothetical protein
MAVAAVLLATCSSPASAVAITGTKVGPSTVDATTKQVIYYLELTSGPTNERFSVQLTPPQFATQGKRDEGQSVDGPLQYAFVGPGTVGQSASDPSFGALCSSRERAFHGYAAGKTSVDVAIPANSATTLAIRYATGRRAPWIDSDYRLKFAFASALVGDYAADSPLFGGPTAITGTPTFTETASIPVKAAGKTKIGAHLLLSETPKATYGDGKAARKIGRRSKVRVSGQLLPKLSGKRVQLQWAKPGGALRTAATAKTRSGGRFSATITPPGRGTYELWASYPSQGGPLAADSTSCPLRYSVR